MGKNSLIKSTSKKKKSQKKTGEQVVQAAGVKTAPAAPSETKTATPKQESSRTPVAKPSYKDLIFKKFSDRQKPLVSEIHPPDKGRYAAPPFYPAAVQAEIKQFKTLLFRKFDLSAPEEETPAQAPLDETAGQSPLAAETAPAEKMVHPVKPTPPLKRITPDQKATIDYIPEKSAKPSDPRDTLMKLIIAVFAFFVLIVVGASFSNHGTYHLVNKNGKTEVWQGRFGPMGQVLLMTLPGLLTDRDETSGSKKEIFPVIVRWHLNKADKTLDVAGTPDFKEIRSLLSDAEPFAVTPELKKEILIRSTVIDLMALLYKAEVAAGLNTAKGFESALSYLQEAKSLKTDAIQMEMISRKIGEIEKKLADPGVISPNALPGAEPEVEKIK